MAEGAPGGAGALCTTVVSGASAGRALATSTEEASDPKRHARHEHAARRFDPEHLAQNEARWREIVDPVELLRPLLDGGERLFVDVGAGVGRMALAAAALLPGARVVAVDRQADMVQWMERRFRDAGLAEARAVVADAAHLPIADGEADAVLFSVVLHDMADPLAALGEARRVLRGQGRLILIEVRPGALEEGPPQALLFAPDQLRRLAAAAGFAPEGVIEGPGPLYRLVARPTP